MSIKSSGKPIARSELGKDVYHWPEFKALCERLGIDWNALTTEITITVPLDGVVKVYHEYNGKSSEEDNSIVIDTTTVHNKEYRTGVPKGQ